MYIYIYNIIYTVRVYIYINRNTYIQVCTYILLYLAKYFRIFCRCLYVCNAYKHVHTCAFAYMHVCMYFSVCRDLWVCRMGYAPK